MIRLTGFSLKIFWNKSNLRLKLDFDVPFTNWTSICCDILQGYAVADGDITLAYLARMTRSTDICSNVGPDQDPSSEQQAHLLRLGLESQHNELRLSMQPHIASLGMSCRPAPFLK